MRGKAFQEKANERDGNIGNSRGRARQQYIRTGRGTGRGKDLCSLTVGLHNENKMKSFILNYSPRARSILALAHCHSLPNLLHSLFLLCCLLLPYSCGNAVSSTPPDRIFHRFLPTLSALGKTRGLFVHFRFSAFATVEAFLVICGASSRALPAS